MQILVNNSIASYDITGAGKPVLLLHGWGDTSRSWHSVRRTLATKYKIITVDLPGFGGSQAPSTSWSLEDYALWVRDFLAKIGQEDLYAVVGHSNGGAIAIRAIAQRYTTPEKLILLASAGVRGESNHKKTAGIVVAKIGNVITRPLPDRVRNRLRQRLYRQMNSEALLLPHMEETFRNIIRDDIRVDAAAVTIPALLIYGEKDEATPVRHGKLLQEHMTNARLEIVPSVGHFVHHDAAAYVEKELQEFLDD